MATYGDESDSYLYSSYNPYSYRYLNSKPKGSSWRQKSYLSSYVDPGEYFDNSQRAQLKSLLSQINPNLTPRLRKANTKDIGIQVNPKTDASVQCSLGPRTLLANNRETLRWRRQTTPMPGSPVNNLAKTVRFPRTLALYSPIAARRPTSFLDEGEKLPGDLGETAEKGKCTSEEKDGMEMTDASVGAAQENKSNGAQKDGQDGNKSRASVRFQVYFKQFCRTCQKAFNPYRVEDITCQICKRARCICTVTTRHVDPKRPHRQDLCGRCKGKRLSCDSTFSFKYII
ncbi:UNVERIFIED_CONTAM: hypothetical protein FKN15_051314 [Acipenser sinensis]